MPVNTTKRTATVEPTILRHKYNGPLHDLLLKACPPDSRNAKSIPILATNFEPEISPWAIYKWVQKGKIPPIRAREIAEFAGGRVTIADFSPFIYQ